MKKILGLDLGTTSIGWALVEESEENKSKIKSVGVRIIPLSTDEENDFKKGKSTTLNSNRTSKRGARRNLQRYKLRRTALLNILVEYGIISKKNKLTNNKGKADPLNIWRLRAKAVTEKIEIDEMARVLFALNKKRGYKSNRKAKDEGEGLAIDGMDLAKTLYNQNITPGEMMLKRLKENSKGTPDFYRSDLQQEFDKIWEKQKSYYPNVLTEELKFDLNEKNKKQTYSICHKAFGIDGIKRNVKGKDLRIENFEWRVQALSQKIDFEKLTVIFQEINSQISGTSGLLSEISDRSKALYFNNLTVGQYLFNQIKTDQHIQLKKQVFYRQDYLDEFEKIWKTQALYHPVLTDQLKQKLRDTIIFYQRRLKSQKGLISVCELEGRELEINKDGKLTRKIIGPRVCPKSSPLFQEFKIWQKLNVLEFKNHFTKEKRIPDLDLKVLLFNELNIRERFSSKQILNYTELSSKEGWELNFKNGLEGNATNAAIYKVFKQIVEFSGHELPWDKLTALETTKTISEVFQSLGIKKEILYFNTDLEGHPYTKQPAYQFWHLLYSYEGDDSKTGDEKLIQKLWDGYGFERQYAKLLSRLIFKDDYGSLSTKALLKIIPYLKAGLNYADAAAHAGYNHSNFITKEENNERFLEKKLDLLPKNSLRNPTVEKILNQLVNVVNAIIDTHGKPDEIRVELARELKKSAKERVEMIVSINQANTTHETIRKKLGLLYPFNTGVRITRNDVIKYKLWEELKDNGYKTLYTNTYIPLENLFSREFDVEHIIPKASLFDDSFSNKTISTRLFNEKKGNKTAFDAVEEYLSQTEKEAYIARLEKLYKNFKISRAKYLKLKMTEKEIPTDFIDRDLRDSQYISKKAKEILSRICRNVYTTTGTITDKLRQDWQLTHVMKELNRPKYEKLRLVNYEDTKDGGQTWRIKDWTKRNDHRHHIMDAITVAFTKPSHIQYFNFLSARFDENHKEHHKIKAIEDKETIVGKNGKRIINPPIPLDVFRSEVKNHLESVFVSFKAKNKVTTNNKNVSKRKGKSYIKIELTPRGQLHKETVYGRKKMYSTKEVRVGGNFDKLTINKVAKDKFRIALLRRLEEFENDPKKAFTDKNSLSKNPIWLDDAHTMKIPDKIKIVEFETVFTIRKEVGPDIKIEKVIDLGVQRKLKERLDQFNGNAKQAFSNLDKNPIWLNKKKRISIKYVTITGVTNAEPLHYKKNHLGQDIFNNQGEKIPTDYVSTGNNHHVAIYKDEEGKLQDKIVSFFEAVQLKQLGLPVIDKTYNQHLEWKFQYSLKQNEMFVFPNSETGFNPMQIDLMDKSNYPLISPNLFRVQKLSRVAYGNRVSREYVFRHHLETTVDEIKSLKEISYKNIKSLMYLENTIKVRINHLGEIVKVGEY